MVHQPYSQSPTAREQYLNDVETNRQRLQDHQTQFGLGTRPELANRRFVSTDGRYVIYYDETGALFCLRRIPKSTVRSLR